MKRDICVIAFLCGFSAFSFAQVNPLLPDSIVGYYFTGRDSVVDSRRVYTYDPHGRVLRVDTYDRAVPWTFTEQWMHYEYTYEPGGNLKTDSISVGFVPTGTWRPMQKSEYSYTDRNRRSVVFTWSHFSKNVWGNPYKTEYQYDLNGNLVAIVPYNWVESSRQWTTTGVPRTYLYDESGRLIRENYRGIDVDISMDFQLDYSYPTDTLRVSRTLKKHPKDSMYFLSQTIEKVYRPDGRIKSQTSYSVNYADGSPDPMNKSVWQYLDDGRAWLKTDYYRNGNYWQLSVRTHYYYPSLVTSIDQVPEAQVAVYPNPTTGTVWLSEAPARARVSVYHQNGQLMRTFNTSGPSLDLSYLQPGTYLLVIESTGKPVQRIKIIRAG